MNLVYAIASWFVFVFLFCFGAAMLGVDSFAFVNLLSQPVGGVLQAFAIALLWWGISLKRKKAPAETPSATPAALP